MISLSYSLVYSSLGLSNPSNTFYIWFGISMILKMSYMIIFQVAFYPNLASEGNPGGQSWNVRQTKWEKQQLCQAGSQLYIWFVFYASLPNEIKLLLFNIFFFGETSCILYMNKISVCNSMLLVSNVRSFTHLLSRGRMQPKRFSCSSTNSIQFLVQVLR